MFYFRCEYWNVCGGDSCPRCNYRKEQLARVSIEEEMKEDESKDSTQNSQKAQLANNSGKTWYVKFLSLEEEVN